MVGVKNNRRTEYTKAQLKSALLTLLDTIPLAKITITDICKQANINRGTFYGHYRDATDLFEAIEADLVAELKPLLKQMSGDIQSWLPPILEIIRSNPSATKIILGNLNESPILQMVLAPVKTKTLANYQTRYHETDPALLNYYYVFFFSGFVRVITKWLEAGAKESPVSIAQILGRIVPPVAEG